MFVIMFKKNSVRIWYINIALIILRFKKCMIERKNMDVDVDVSDEAFTKDLTPNEDQGVTSYGISIKTSNIKSINVDEQAKELRHLDVNVYEQEQFESGIIDQVDSAINQAEVNFKRNIIKKEIEQIHQEIRYIENYAIKNYFMKLGIYM